MRSVSLALECRRQFNTRHFVSRCQCTWDAPDAVRYHRRASKDRKGRPVDGGLRSRRSHAMPSRSAGGRARSAKTRPASRFVMAAIDRAYENAPSGPQRTPAHSFITLRLEIDRGAFAARPASTRSSPRPSCQPHVVRPLRVVTRWSPSFITRPGGWELTLWHSQLGCYEEQTANSCRLCKLVRTGKCQAERRFHLDSSLAPILFTYSPLHGLSSLLISKTTSPYCAPVINCNHSLPIVNTFTTILRKTSSLLSLI